MGWSCRAEASDVMKAWTAACVADTGSANVFVVKGTEYFWELSRTEHYDGAITGTIMKVVEKRADGVSMAVRSGTFRIEGDGTVTRAPAFLKKAAKAS